MPKLFVNKSVKINASASTVWEILTKPEFTKEWIKEFSPEFTLLESDWKMDSPVSWKDKDGKVHVAGKVTANDPHKILRFTVRDANERLDGHLDFTPEDGITYKFSENNGETTLDVAQGDFSPIGENAEKYHHMTELTWDKVLPKVKTMAEWIEKLKKEGYTDLKVCPIAPNIDSPTHTHDLPTVHVILNGDLTITDNLSTKIFHPGDYIEFPAGTSHKAKGEKESGSMIVGVKKS